LPDLHIALRSLVVCMRVAASGKRIEVFYLIRWSNPVSLTTQFAQSYLSCLSGADHVLTLLCKGFRQPDDIAQHSAQFTGISPQIVSLPDVGYDIGAYRSALELSRSELCCFLNSYSVIQSPYWLKMLSEIFVNPSVGVVGATASYEGSSPLLMRNFSSGYSAFRLFARFLRNSMAFPAFPNPHVRTNAFMIRREIFPKLVWPRNPSRRDALKFESGRHSLTRQILRMNMDAVVVGRDGRYFRVSEWPASGTFRSNDQHNLLVGDNRTIEYATAEPDLRRELTMIAWGNTSRNESGQC